MDHPGFLEIAVDEAIQSGIDDNPQVGAVIVKGEEIVARSHDRTAELNDPTAVAEVDCIRKAGRRNDQTELTLYSTRYPDMLCAGTILQFSIGTLVIGLEPTSSAVINLLNEKGVPVIFSPQASCARLSNQ
jgi:creatinine deaminase